MQTTSRNAYIALGVIIALIVGFFVVKAFVPSFGVIEGRHDVVEVGEPIEILVMRKGDVHVTVTVTELYRVAESERAQWRIKPTLPIMGNEHELDDRDIYFIRYSVSSDDTDNLTVVPRLWRLLDDTDEVHPAALISVPDEANCERFDGMGAGCAVVAVPEGTDVTMVRFYGVSLARKQLTGENWAGWTP